MAIQYVGGASGGNTTSPLTISLTSLTGGIDTQPREGDVVIVIVGDATQTDQNKGLGTGGYTAIKDLFVKGSTYYDNSYSFYKVMGSTPDTSVVTPTSSSSSLGLSTCVQVFRGVNITNPLDVAVTFNTGGGVNPQNAAITPITPGALVVVMATKTSSATARSATVPTGYTNLLSFFRASSQSQLTMMASKLWSGSGAETPSNWTINTNGGGDCYTAITISLRPEATLNTTNFFQFF